MSASTNPNPSPQSANLTVHPATQASVSISAILAMVLYALQTFGVLTPTQATNIQQIVTEVTTVLQPVIQNAVQDAIKQNLPTPAVAPKTDPATPATPVQPAPADELKADLAKLAAQLNTLQQTVVTKPIVDPTKPIVVPIGPSATIVTQDAKGKPLPVDNSKAFSTAERNKQFLMMSTGTTHAGKATSIQWNLLKSSEDDVDASPIPASDGSGATAGYAVTMRNQSTLTVMLSATQDNVLAATSLIVKCSPTNLPSTVINQNPTPIIQTTPQPQQPQPVPQATSSTASFAEAIAHQAEIANSSPALLATDVLDGILKQGPEAGMPQSFVDAVRKAVPAVGVKPPRDLTPAEVAAIRAIK